jgi:uncharacterized protein (DUF885 family)
MAQRFRRPISVLALLAIPLAAAVPAAAQDESARLAALIAKEWEQRLADNPLAQTYAGRHEHDGEMPDFSLPALARQVETTRGFLKELKAIDRSRLAGQDVVNYDVFGWSLQAQVEEWEVGQQRFPITSDSGFHTEITRLADGMRFASVEDYENYLSRMRALPTYFAQHIEMLRDGIRNGMVLPRISLAGYDVTITTHIVDQPEKSRFWGPFERFPVGVPESERPRLATAARAAIREAVVPSFESFRDFLAKEYLPASRDSVGASEMKGGREYYEQRVRYFTTLEMTAEEVHRKGLEEVARIEAEMREIIGKVGFKGSFADFLAFLRTDPRFYAKTPQELMERASFLAKKADAKLPAFFGRLPRLPYGVEPVPDYLAPVYTSGRYVPAARGSKQAGTYWVNTYALDKRPLYALEALTLHEAVPGHHLQGSLSQEMENVPEFRRDLYISAFGEGWGLYCERLGIEMGFYTDPYADFGRLTYEMWRAARLVVDTGMHAKGWTRDQALEYLGSHTALSLHEVKTEIDRYIAWPGQALSYKIGELHIRALRAKAEKELGGSFDVRVFHDKILENGAVPLPVLSASIEAWIAAAGTAAAKPAKN